MAHGWDGFFDTYTADSNCQLSNERRKKLINNVVELAIEHFGFYPSQADKIMISKAVVALFPCLETSPSTCGGIVSHIYPLLK